MARSIDRYNVAKSAGRSVCRRCCRGAIRGWFPNLELALRATQAIDALLLYERYAVSHNGTGSHIKPFACQIDAIEGKRGGLEKVGNRVEVER